MHDLLIHETLIKIPVIDYKICSTYNCSNKLYLKRNNKFIELNTDIKHLYKIGIQLQINRNIRQSFEQIHKSKTQKFDKTNFFFFSVNYSKLESKKKYIFIYIFNKIIKRKLFCSLATGLIK